MKRKFALIEDSDDDVVSDTIINKYHVSNISPKHKQRNRFKQILYINLIILSIFLIPFLAIKSLNQDPILDTIDKLIGERCSSHTWVPKNITTRILGILCISEGEIGWCSVLVASHYYLDEL